MQVLACIQVLFITATTTKYAILDLILLNADTDVSTTIAKREQKNSSTNAIFQHVFVILYARLCKHNFCYL